MLSTVPNWELFIADVPLATKATKIALHCHWALGRPVVVKVIVRWVGGVFLAFFGHKYGTSPFFYRHIMVKHLSMGHFPIAMY